MKRFVHYFLAFLIPICIFLFAMYLMDIYPFGDISFRITDAISQYPAFFEGLKDGDLFTFKIGMGTNFYTIWTTYLASPLSLLYLFFENYQFDTFFVILILLKIGLIGLNMNILLNYGKMRNKYSLIFSTIYALSGFVSLYYFNYQFLDALYMLPLIMIGIDKIVHDNKNLMYFITLTLMIIFHYYTAYMICIFSVIYFFFLLINSELDKKSKKKRIIKFFITSLFCGLCSSFITIPSIYSLMQGRSTYYSGIDYFSFNKDGLSLFYNLTSGNTFITDLTNTTAPVFITLFILILIVYLFFDKTTTKKYKISMAIILFIYFISLSFNLFYYGWHVFQHPVGLPGRFVFTFNCFFVLIAYKIFIDKNIEISFRKKIIISIFIIILFGISFLYKIYNVNLSIILIDKRYVLVFILNLLTVIFYIFFIKNKKLIILTFFLVILEILINVICSFNVSFAYINYENLYVSENNKNIKEISNYIKKLNNDEFYRMEIYEAYNSGMLYGYNGASYYASLYNINLNSFVQNNHANFLHDFNGHSLVYKPYFLFDSLISLNYVLNYFNDNNEMQVYYNPYVINSLGFMVSDKNKDDLVRPIENVVDTYTLLTNYKLELKELTPTKKLVNVIEDDGVFKIKNMNMDGEVFLEYEILEDSLVYLNQLHGFYFENMDTNFKKNSYELINLYLNDEKVPNVFEVKKGDIVRMDITLPKELGILPEPIESLKYVDKELFKNIIEYLNQNTIKNLEFSSDGFTGSLHFAEDKGLLLLTIPYDENIEIYANGKKYNTSKYLGGIIGVELERGEYQIKFKYRIKGLKMGIILSLNSLVIFLSIKMLEKNYISRYNYIDNKEEF